MPSDRRPLEGVSIRMGLAMETRDGVIFGIMCVPLVHTASFLKWAAQLLPTTRVGPRRINFFLSVLLAKVQ